MEKLVKSGHLKPLAPTPLPQNPPPSHNPNLFCAYHQMPSHHTDSCYRLLHAIQDLINDGTLQTPPSTPNVISNSMPKHNSNLQISQINPSSTQINPSSTQNDFNSTIFNSTRYIIQENHPMPIVTIPSNLDINMMAVGWKMEDKANEWKELSKDSIERYNMGFPAFPHVDQVWLEH
ncbi:hypothetical protein RHMOL_Rhmol04G0234800 [Rhododendron molle]|uniref:Uncharacterized protein n=1 Tax=Rhododendron molle TaxID=49168 RepID=A0ACC0P4S0_RHOML|nr:hypothetical protein RHMOL_Rhmol04G0234800 [Rhododendron molle]